MIWWPGTHVLIIGIIGLLVSIAVFTYPVV
jgi:hypothetical protein